MNRLTTKAAAAAACAALLLNGCATEGAISASTGQPLSEVQKAQQNCRAAIVGAAILGGIIGAAASSRNRGSGAAIGAGAGALVGTGFCGVMLSVAGDKDRLHIAEAQRLALETGRDQADSFTGDDGKTRTIRVSTVMVEPASTGLANPDALTGCRKRYTDIQVEDHGGAQINEVICRKADGSYVTRKI